jgi:hypothetical protein
MTAIIAIFDDSVALEKALTRLSNTDFEPWVIDPANTPVERGVAVAGLPPYPTLVRPAIDVDDSGELPPDGIGYRETLREQLSELSVANEELRFYEEAFEHGGKFVIIETGSEDADEAVDIMQQCGASRVDQHS